MWVTSSAVASDTRLVDAIEVGDSELASSLLLQGVDVQAAQQDGMTALHWAVWRDDDVLTGELLAAGAAADATNRYSVTPLSIACVNGNAVTVAKRR